MVVQRDPALRQPFFREYFNPGSAVPMQLQSPEPWRCQHWLAVSLQKVLMVMKRLNHGLILFSPIHCLGVDAGKHQVASFYIPVR